MHFQRRMAEKTERDVTGRPVCFLKKRRDKSLHAMYVIEFLTAEDDGGLVEGQTGRVMIWRERLILIFLPVVHKTV